MPEPCFHSRSTSKSRIGIKTRPQMRNASHNAETLGGEFHGRPPGHGSRYSHGRRADDCALGFHGVISRRCGSPDGKRDSRRSLRLQRRCPGLDKDAGARPHQWLWHNRPPSRERSPQFPERFPLFRQRADGLLRVFVMPRRWWRLSRSARLWQACPCRSDLSLFEFHSYSLLYDWCGLLLLHDDESAWFLWLNSFTEHLCYEEDDDSSDKASTSEEVGGGLSTGPGGGLSTGPTPNAV